MRTKEWEIGGKRTKSRGRIGRGSIKARTKESATATTTRSQAQHRLITLLHTSDLSLMKSIAKNRQSKPFDSELKTCRGKKKKRFSCIIRWIWKRGFYSCFVWEREYIYREIEREVLGVLSLPQESKEEKRMREREAGVVRKTNPFRGVCVWESFLSVLLCFCFINFFIIIIITIFLFSFFFFDFDLVLVFFILTF